MRVETIQPVDGGPGTRTPVKMACSLIRRLAIAQPRLGGSRRKREEANNGETRDDGELPPSPLPFRSPKRQPTVTATTLPPSLGPVSCSPERRPIGKPWTLQSRQGVACQSAVSTSLFFSTLLDLHSGTVSSPGRTYHRDRAPNQPSNLCPSSSRLLVNTDRGEQRVNNLPKQNRLVSRTLFSPPSSSCSHPSTPQLLASKYSQPRAASHAPTRLRLSLSHPHCGWTPQRHNLKLTSRVAAAASLCGPRHAASRSRPSAFALPSAPPVHTLRHPICLAIGLRVPSKILDRLVWG